MTEHSFHGIHTSRLKKRKCNPCVRYELSPMSRAAQTAQNRLVAATAAGAGSITGGAWGKIRMTLRSGPSQQPANRHITTQVARTGGDRSRARANNPHSVHATHKRRTSLVALGSGVPVSSVSWAATFCGFLGAAMGGGGAPRSGRLLSLPWQLRRPVPLALNSRATRNPAGYPARSRREQPARR